MPYQAEEDATIPRVIATGTNVDGEAVATYESVCYAAGAVIYEGDIAPHVLRRLEGGDDDHLSSLLRYIDDTEADKILREQSSGADLVNPAEQEILHQEQLLDGGSDEPSEQPVIGSVEGSDETEPEEEGAETEGSGDEVEEDSEGGEEVEEEVEEESSGGSGDGSGEEDSEEEDEEADEDEEAGEVESDSEGDEVSAETDDDGLDSMSKSALKKKAGEMGIEGRSKMDEAQLIEAIRAANSPDSE